MRNFARRDDSEGNSHEINHALFDQLTDAVMVTDLEGNLKSVNSGLCNMLGYSRQELLEMNAMALVDLRHLEENPPHFDLLAKGEKILNERLMVHKSGAIVHAETNVKKILDNRVLSIFRDITRHKKVEQTLEECKASLEGVFETSDSIYILTDINLRIVAFNSRAADFSRNELGRDFRLSGFLLDYFPDDKGNLLGLHAMRALAGQSVSYDMAYAHADGSENRYQIRLVPRSGNSTVYGLILELNDLAEQEFLETKLANCQSELQREISKAALNAQEHERNKIGQELHDNVNQLLSTIRLYISMIGTDSFVKKDLLESTNQYLDLAMEEIRALSRGHVTPPQNFNLKEFIERICEQLSGNDTVKTTFQCDVAEPLHIDEELKLHIYRIVQEQTNNIVKYAEASKAVISVRAQDNFVYVLIKDNGRGFDPLENRNGIGISNMINRVESYNGKLHLEASPGKGCKIEMRIPVG